MYRYDISKKDICVDFWDRWCVNKKYFFFKIILKILYVLLSLFFIIYMYIYLYLWIC